MCFFNRIRFDLVKVPPSDPKEICALCLSELSEGETSAAHWIRKNRRYGCFIHADCIEATRNFAIQNKKDFACPCCRRSAQNAPAALPPTLFQACMSYLPRPRNLALLAASPFLANLLQRMTFLPSLFAFLGAFSAWTVSGLAIARATEWLRGTERSAVFSLASAAAALGSASALTISDGGIKAFSLAILSCAWSAGTFYIAAVFCSAPMIFLMRAPPADRRSSLGVAASSICAGLAAYRMGSGWQTASGLALIPWVANRVFRS